MRAVVVLFVLLGLLAAPSAARAQSSPVGCGYGAGGAYASTLCWLDMSAYNDALSRGLSGQRMSATLPGGYILSFMVTSRPVPGASSYPAVESRPVPLERRFAFGSSDYVGVPGRPVLYSLDAGNDNGVTLTLGDITVVDASGTPVTGYSLVIADAENNIATPNERFTWTSDRPLELVAVMNPTSTRGCHNALTGVGTMSVTCIGQGADPPGAGTSPVPLYDGVIVGADTPSTIGLTLRTAARSGVAFAIMTSKVQVTKNVVGRVRGGDSFDVSATSPEGSTIASASTGPANSVTTGELTVLPRSNGASYVLGEAATPGSDTRLDDYAQSWSCRNNGAPDPALPSGSGRSVRVSPTPGADVECTVTNSQLPADLAIEKTGAPTPVVPGTAQTFSLVVRNDGASRATDVVVTDNLPAEFAFASASPGCAEAGGTVTCTISALAPGESRTFTISGTVASGLEHCLANTATVSSITPDVDTGDAASSVCLPIRGEVDLSIAKSASTATLPVGGGQVMYTLIVGNAGPSDATGVTVTDPMASNLTVTSANPSQGTCTTTGGRVSCDLGTLVAGGSSQVLVTAEAAAAPGAIANTAEVRGGQVEQDPADNRHSATVTVPAPSSVQGPAPPAPEPFDLDVTKRAHDREVAVGEPVTYRLLVANRGPGAAPDVKLTDTLSAPGRLLSVSPAAGTCRRRLPLTCELGTLAPGTSVAVTVTVAHRTSGRRQRNAVSAVAAGRDARAEDNLARVDVRVRKVRLKLTKTATRSTVDAGERFGYRITVRNRTRGTARRVKVCDRLPAGLVHVRSQPRSRLRQGRRCWTIDRLGPRRRQELRVTVRAVAGTAGRKRNTATATSPDASPARARATVRVRPRDSRAGGVTG